ncbi:hypothetical protein R0K17_24170, partial [Planococcus sp. SIMBA_143]
LIICFGRSGVDRCGFDRLFPVFPDRDLSYWPALLEIIQVAEEIIHLAISVIWILPGAPVDDIGKVFRDLTL